MSAKTTNSSPETETAKPSDKPLWENILDSLEEMRAIKPSYRHGGAVKFSRAYDMQNKHAVWMKSYHDTKDYNLSVFNDWECALLLRVLHEKLVGCYKPKSIEVTPSPIHSGNTPLNEQKHQQSRIRTIHAGPDLGLWKKMHLRINQKSIDHAFYSPVNYLKLVQGILSALHGLHSSSFTHCDLSPENMVLPASIERQNGGSGEIIKITPQWGQLTIIDLGYSLCEKIQPYTTLPLSTDEGTNPKMSIHLRTRLNIILTLAKEYRAQYYPSMAIGDVIYSKSFWSKWKPFSYLTGNANWRTTLQQKSIDVYFLNKLGWNESDRQIKESPLTLLQSIDWREDLYQLGFFLHEIIHSDTWPNGVNHSNRELNSLIFSLPERLMQWGKPDQLTQPPPEDLPHSDLINEISTALRNVDVVANEHQNNFFLYRIDHDPAYRKRLEWWHRLQALWRNPRVVGALFLIVFLSFVANNDFINSLLGGTAVLPLLIITSLVIWKLVKWAQRNVAQTFARQCRSAASSRWSYLLLTALLAWGAESQYDLSLRAKELYLVWQAGRYAEGSQRIKRGDWWDKARGEANAAEKDWLETTHQLADQGMALTQFHWAQSRCYGMQAGGRYVRLDERNAKACGAWLSAALQQSRQWYDRQGDFAGWSDMLSETDTLLKMQYNQPESTAFERALLPGLEAVAPLDANLTASLAYIYACRLDPPQTDAARRTLQAWTARHPDDARAMPVLERICAG